MIFQWGNGRVFPVNMGKPIIEKSFQWQIGDKHFKDNWWRGVGSGVEGGGGLHREIIVRSCQAGRRFLNTSSTNLKTVNLNILPSYGGTSTLMFSFHVDPDLDILLEKLAAQIRAWLGSETQLCFQTPDDLWVDIVKIQRSTLD